jgi:hypothetical protein
LRRRSGKFEEINRLDHPVVLKLTRVGASFYIPRDKKAPPPELLKLDGFLKVRDAVKPIPEHRLYLAGAGFANLLQQFRRYLLQDSAILRPMFPTHPIWAHDVFRHPLYAPFARVRFQHSNSPESTRCRSTGGGSPAADHTAGAQPSAGDPTV